ncbi:ABC transporter permease [Planotetraspora sp. A-T 1434]|uniref:ABC transporter permease n=1 Tax=Planotetraspora sp. A-T 1434 TaxID=2979219 RepID=UPI0021BFC09A|nr:ABC transporter permease [Planotetraspora sp. A-T 1434]MCT9930780.1 ABC transporter permease [Planotetraspora sp. A-T 1434]
MRFGVVTLVLLALCAALGPPLAPYDPAKGVGGINEPPSAAHLFGTTGQGQDVLSQFLYGCRVSLLIAFAVALITTLISLAVGLLAAYAGGRTDDVLSSLTNVFLVLPGLPLIVVLAAFLPPGPVTIVAVLSLTGWAFGARLFRSQALSLRQREFIAAARLAGESRWRVLAVELLPNMLSIVAAFFVNQVIFAVGAEASLEFLGLGDSGQVTWGTMLFWAQNGSALLQGAWWTFVIPGLGIALTAFSLALINHAVDERTNPRLRASDLLRQAIGMRQRSAVLVTPVVRDA